MKRTLILCLALIAGFGLLAQEDPLSEAIVAGRTTFSEAGGIGCVACHGSYGLGDLQIGPNIRGLDAIRIEGALDAAEEMDFLGPLLSGTDIDNLAAYLQYLGTLETASTLYRSGAFEPAELSIVADTPTQLIVANGGRSECTFALDGVELEPVLIGGRGSGDVVLTLPAETGTLQGSCAEAPEVVLTLTIDSQAGE
jgi:cytochrome c553